MIETIRYLNGKLTLRFDETKMTPAELNWLNYIIESVDAADSEMHEESEAGPPHTSSIGDQSARQYR